MTNAAYDYSDLKEGTEENLGDNSVKQLAGLARDLDNAELLVEQLATQLGEAEANVTRLKEHTIPELMEQLELEKFTLKSGDEIKVSEKVFGSIKKDDRPAAHAYLEEIGNGALVKRQFVISFGLGDEAWAAKFQRDLNQRKKKVACERKDAVPPQSLQAFVRRQIAEGIDLNLTLLGVHRKTVATIKRKK